MKAAFVLPLVAGLGLLAIAFWFLWTGPGTQINPCSAGPDCAKTFADIWLGLVAAGLGLAILVLSLWGLLRHQGKSR